MTSSYIIAGCRTPIGRLLGTLSSLPARRQALERSHYPADGKRAERMVAEPKEGDFWEADHIRPVAEGGGESDLSNFQTLCVPCHAKKTKEQATRAKGEKRKQVAVDAGAAKSCRESGGRGASGERAAAGQNGSRHSLSSVRDGRRSRRAQVAKGDAQPLARAGHGRRRHHLRRGARGGSCGQRR